MTRLLTTLSLMLAVLIGSSGVSHADLKRGKLVRENGNYKMALRELMPLAEQGNPDAQNEIGGMHELGEGVPKNIETAITWYKKSALQGFANATLNLGKLYEKGENVPQNYRMAIDWYRLSLIQGGRRAAENLEWMYKEGRGVPPLNIDMAISDFNSNSFSEARRKFEILSEIGNFNASFYLGTLHKRGDGGARESPSSSRLFYKICL